MAHICVSLAVALIAAFGASPAEANSLYIASKCRGHTCTNTHYPILDFDPVEGTCHCSGHPCWDDGGNLHTCPGSSHPYLFFAYNRVGALSCGCSASPFYSSVHVAKDLCPGFQCDSPTLPSLDYNEETKMCTCKPNPCWDVAGMKHGCDDSKSPILRYREDLVEGEVKAMCECISRLEQPKKPNVEM